VRRDRNQAPIKQEQAALRKDGPTAYKVERARNSIQSALVFRSQLMGGDAAPTC
jgi:hypothetical protein